MISWEPTPPNCAVTGLATLLGREEWRTHPDGERIRQLLRPQLDSTDDTVRMLASRALPMLIEPEDLTDDLCERLAREDNGAVIEVLTGTLAARVASDPDGTDACLGHLAVKPAWSVLAGNPEDRSTPPSKRCDQYSVAADSRLTGPPDEAGGCPQVRICRVCDGSRRWMGIERDSDAARRSLVLKTGASSDDRAASLLSAVVCPGHPGSSGIGGDGMGSLVHGTGVPILFPSHKTCGSR